MRLRFLWLSMGLYCKKNIIIFVVLKLYVHMILFNIHLQEFGVSLVEPGFILQKSRCKKIEVVCSYGFH